MSIINPISAGTRAAVKEVLSGIIPMMQAPDFTLEEFDLEVATARGMVERSLNRYAAAEAKKNAKLAKTEPATPQSNTAVPVDSAIAVLVEAVSDAAGELATEEPQVVPTRLSKATKTAK